MYIIEQTRSVGILFTHDVVKVNCLLFWLQISDSLNGLKDSCSLILPLTTIPVTPNEIYFVLSEENPLLWSRSWTCYSSSVGTLRHPLLVRTVSLVHDAGSPSMCCPHKILLFLPVVPTLLHDSVCYRSTSTFPPTSVYSIREWPVPFSNSEEDPCCPSATSQILPFTIPCM